MVEWLNVRTVRLGGIKDLVDNLLVRVVLLRIPGVIITMLVLFGFMVGPPTGLLKINLATRTLSGLKAIGRLFTTGQRILMGSTILTALTSCLKIEAEVLGVEDHAGQEIQTTVTHLRVTFMVIVLAFGLEITWVAAPPKFGATPVVTLNHMGGLIMLSK